MTGASATRARILAVVVLYKQIPSQSVTVNTLMRAARVADIDCCIWLHDNSPAEGRLPLEIPEGCRYHHAPENRGLYAAYESARHFAGTQDQNQGYDWLLTLDQDTVLPENFFSAIEPGLRAAAANPRIAAIVPHLAEGGQLLSPAYVGFTRPSPLPASFSGVPDREARAFNSAALLRVAALDDIGGFEPCFWLDHLDTWLHHVLFLRGWKIFVLDAVHLEHHFSLLNYKERVSLARFCNFLGAEAAYIDLYGSWLAGMAYRAQLGVRLVNQRRRRELPEIRRATRQALWRQLTVSQAKRLAEWRASLGGWPGAAQRQPR